MLALVDVLQFAAHASVPKMFRYVPDLIESTRASVRTKLSFRPVIPERILGDYRLGFVGYKQFTGFGNSPIVCLFASYDGPHSSQIGLVEAKSRALFQKPIPEKIEDIREPPTIGAIAGFLMSFQQRYPRMDVASLRTVDVLMFSSTDSCILDKAEQELRHEERKLGPESPRPADDEYAFLWNDSDDAELFARFLRRKGLIAFFETGVGPMRLIAGGRKPGDLRTAAEEFESEFGVRFLTQKTPTRVVIESRPLMLEPPQGTSVAKLLSRWSSDSLLWRAVRHLEGLGKFRPTDEVTLVSYRLRPWIGEDGRTIDVICGEIAVRVHSRKCVIEFRFPGNP